MDEIAEKIIRVREMIELLETRRTRRTGRDLEAAVALRARVDAALDEVVGLALDGGE